MSFFRSLAVPADVHRKMSIRRRRGRAQMKPVQITRDAETMV
jgi:hypothetical protein